MPYDDVLIVAPNNPEGVRVDMDRVSTAAGAVVLREKTEIVGISGEFIAELLVVNRKQLAVLRAILAQLNEGSGTAFKEEDFYNID